MESILSSAKMDFFCRDERIAENEIYMLRALWRQGVGGISRHDHTPTMLLLGAAGCTT